MEAMWFQPASGNQTSTRISESGVGVSRAVTRQKGGSALNTAAADAFVDPGALKPPAGTLSAESTVPFAIGSHEIFTTVSTGIAVSTTGYERPEDVLRDADIAMYRAKAQGKARHEVFDAAMHARAVELLQFETDLRRAIERGELRVHYQPLIDLASGALTGFEALVRWQRGETLIAAQEIISVAEETGLIVPIGEWVLREALRQMKEWDDAGLTSEGIDLHVNLSPRQLLQPNVVVRLKEIIARGGVAPERLHLEVTESLLIENAAAAAELLRALRDVHVGLSLDDFGTGYSNLSYLKRFPLDFLKVDRSFVQDVTTSPDDAAIVRAVISLGHSLGLAVVAEGVETEAQVEWLRRERCEQIQGYVFSRPLPAAQFEALLRSRKGLPSRGTGAQDGKTLLIVDDDAGVAASVVRVLRRDGYHVLTAPNAKDALDLMALNVVHVVISDHRMPAMTGAELLGKVKLLYPDTVRILFSGYIEIEALTEAVNRGAIYRFLLKPWDDETLRESVRQAFHHYWLTHTLKERTG